MGDRRDRGYPEWPFAVAFGLIGLAACGGGGHGKPPGGDGSIVVDARAPDDGGAPADGRPNGDRVPPVTSPDPSSPVVLTILPASDAARPFQHAAEVSIAAHDGHVVVATLNIHTDGPETLAAASPGRGVGLAVSRDFGDTFAPTVDPGLVASGAAETSDPVVRVTTSGTFWFSTLVAAPGSSFSARGMLLRSRDDGQSWEIVHRDLPIFDKEWLATTDDGGLVMGANGGFWRFDGAGTLQASWTTGPDWGVMGAYADTHTATFVIERSIARWTGEAQIAGGVALLAGTAFGDWVPGWSVPIGPTDDGGTWAIYDRQPLTAPGRDAVVELRLFAPDDSVGEAIPISAPGVPAFMPAAAVDGDGRLHVIWYESAGAHGVLKYARSVSRDLRMGFSPDRIVDPDACPGDGWIAQYSASAPDRRLREYVDIAVDGHRVHAAWTHASVLPSRIYTSHWDF